MLQFITILSISTILSVAAYKMQHSEMQAGKKLQLDTRTANSALLQLSSYSTD
ncbi:MAG: hypothetical protein KBD04_04825 [Proteobacteria bacterium]|jgi:hypothetical protein|nr:hypothetical protein [Pseudomonadota bacterium]